MVETLSSSTASALANFLAFLGISWVIFRALWPILKKGIANFGQRARRIRQNMILLEITRLREFTKNTHLLVYHICKNVLHSVFLGFSAPFIVISASVSLVANLDRLLRIPPIAAVIFGQFTFFFLVTLLFVRQDLKVIRDVAKFNSSRRLLLMEYIAIRAKR